jgi:hypothetical protein
LATDRVADLLILLLLDEVGFLNRNHLLRRSMLLRLYMG